MSEFMSKLMARVEALEQALPALEAQIEENYNGPCRRRDDQIEDAVSRASLVKIVFPLGCITSQRPEIARRTHQWSSSYTTGGEDVGAVSAMVPGFSTVEASPLAGYTFQYIPGTNKLMAFTTAGTEVAAATNLQTAIGDTPVNVVGVQSGKWPCYRAKAGDTIVQIEIESETTLDASATNYWEFVVRRRAQGLEYGVDVGDTLSTASFGLTARTPFTLYEDEIGTRLAADEEIVVYGSGSGSVRGSLDGVTVTVTIQRKVT